MNECVLMLFSLNIFIVDSIFLVSNQSVKFHDLVSLDFYRRIDISTYPISLFFLVSPRNLCPAVGFYPPFV